MDTTPATTVHAAPVSTRPQRRGGLARATAVTVAALLLMGLLPPLDAAGATPHDPPAGSAVEEAVEPGSVVPVAIAATLVGLVGGLLVRGLVRRGRAVAPTLPVEVALDSPDADLDPEARLAEALAAGSARRAPPAAKAADLPLWLRRLDPDAGPDDPR